METWTGGKVMLENLQEWTRNNLVEKVIDFLPHLLLAVIILGVGFWLSNLVGKLVVKTLKNRNVDATIYPLPQELFLCY